MGANCFCIDLMYSTNEVLMCFLVTWLQRSLNRSAFMWSMYSASSLSSGLPLLLKLISGRLVSFWKSIIEFILCYHLHHDCVRTNLVVFLHSLHYVFVW